MNHTPTKTNDDSHPAPTKSDDATAAMNARDIKRLKAYTRALFVLFLIGAGVIVWMKMGG